MANPRKQAGADVPRNNVQDLIATHEARRDELRGPYLDALQGTQREHQVLSDEAFAALRAETAAQIAQLEQQKVDAAEQRDSLTAEAEKHLDVAREAARELYVQIHQHQDAITAAEGELFTIRNDHVRFHEAEVRRRHYRALLHDEGARRDAECAPYKGEYEELVEKLADKLAETCARWALVDDKAALELNRYGGFAELSCINTESGVPTWLPRGHSYTEPQSWMTEEEARDWVELQECLADSKALLLRAYDLSAYACRTQAKSLAAFAKSIRYDAQKRYIEMGGTHTGNSNIWDNGDAAMRAKAKGDPAVMAKLVEQSINQPEGN